MFCFFSVLFFFFFFFFVSFSVYPQTPIISHFFPLLFVALLRNGLVGETRGCCEVGVFLCQRSGGSRTEKSITGKLSSVPGLRESSGSEDRRERGPNAGEGATPAR